MHREAKLTMTVQRYQIRQCEEIECHFRFPIVEESTLGHRCPKCGGKARLINAPYTAHEVEIGKFVSEGAEIEALLDNIRSVFNVGNMLRTADGAGIRHMHLCGITPTPNSPKLAKTALGAERSVHWTQHRDGLAAAVSLRKQGLRLWALEGGSRAESLFDARVDPQGSPIVLVVGSEISGVDPGILEHCEKVLCLPMQGVKNTLNVAVAFGIAAYFLRFALAEDKAREVAGSTVI
jgi:23S rRNA (guanosine2251-2'-O)-methyltransferase